MNNSPSICHYSRKYQKQFFLEEKICCQKTALLFSKFCILIKIDAKCIRLPPFTYLSQSTAAIQYKNEHLTNIQLDFHLNTLPLPSEMYIIGGQAFHILLLNLQLLFFIVQLQYRYSQVLFKVGPFTGHLWMSIMKL